MKKVLLIVLILLFTPALAMAAGLGQKLSGQILLDVERNGEAWYVYPENNKRYYLGRPADAFRVMRELGLGITELDFQKIAQAGMPIEGDRELAKKLSGKIILQVEQNGEAWYIYPKDLKKYYLGRPTDAFQIMRQLGLGINREDLAQVHKPALAESINQYSKYEHKTISTPKGDFNVDVVEIDLANPNLRIITDAVEPHPDTSPRPSSLNEFGTSSSQGEGVKQGSCGAQSLGKFILEENGFAGINGTYFCSDSGCGAQNYYFYPVYDTSEKALVNESELKYWTTGPIMAWDENNKFYYFKDSREFVGVENFENKYGVKLQAAIGNKPRLIEEGMNLLIDWDIDAKQKDTKAIRNAIGYKNNIVYLVVAQNATVPDLADIMQAMEIDYALNLDGGLSSALWYNGEYMVGPGRDVPNAIVFAD